MLPDGGLKGQDDEQDDSLNEEKDLRGERRWKRDDRISLPEKVKRSLAREQSDKGVAKVAEGSRSDGNGRKDG